MANRFKIADHWSAFLFSPQPIGATFPGAHTTFGTPHQSDRFFDSQRAVFGRLPYRDSYFSFVRHGKPQANISLRLSKLYRDEQWRAKVGRQIDHGTQKKRYLKK
jgi:hypothetical protein